MQPTVIILYSALLIDLAMGTIVYLTNRKRTANQQFLILSSVIAFWIACVISALQAVSDERAELFIRWAFLFSSFIPTCFNLLRHILVNPSERLGRAAYAQRYWLIANAAVAALSLTHWMMAGVRLPAAQADTLVVAEPVYGPGFHIFSLYFIVSIISLMWRFKTDIRHLTGLQRVEVQFMLLGACLALLSGSASALILPLLTGSSSSSPFAPIGIVLHNLVVAYGIATHRIMDVPHVLRRLTAYALLTIYLGMLYMGGFILVDSALTLYGINAHSLVAHTLATLIVTFSMAPASTRLQELSRRLFVNVHALNFTETIQRANRMLASIRTLPELTRQFSGLLSQAFGTDRVFLYLQDGDRLRLYHAEGSPTPPEALDADETLLALIAADREPLVRDILSRLPPTPALRTAARRLAEWQASVAIGIYSKEAPTGLLLLGPRLSGRIYGVPEQQALRALCDQFAVAQENARLYTEVQDAKNYNEKLLDNLVSGVVAVDAARRVTVFNLEAQRITRIDASAVLNQTPDLLPEPLRKLIALSFETGEVPRDREVSWRIGPGSGPGEEVTVRVGGTRLADYTGQPAGALLVFHDVSTLKKLESQVRRTDRLASLGTLSAGMAHEIKNPLVTLKTFVQLLPERYDDVDFRTTFAALLGDEVMRIDRLVNQLLRFARPTKPTLAPLHLHQVAAHVLKLVGEQARQKNIVCVSELRAEQDSILGDHDLLVQALLNLLFNAIEAMGREGTLTVSSTLVDQETPQMGLWGEPVTRTFIRLTVRDTGPGIRAEDVPHVFDPFFTTKSSGTGLGLSVAHGIIQEHHGLVDVESEMGRGTAFHLLFPLARQEVAA